MIHNLFMLTFPSAPPTTTRGTPPQTTSLISASPECQPSSSDAKTQLTFLKSPKCYAHASGAWRHSLPIWGFILTSVNDASFTRAREHLRSCLHLTNPCTKRKVLCLTKPKGKIYKTKSLGHYVTIVKLFMNKVYWTKTDIIYYSTQYYCKYIPL